MTTKAKKETCRILLDILEDTANGEKTIKFKFYCEQCDKYTNPMQVKNVEKRWFDVCCSECKFVIATVNF